MTKKDNDDWNIAVVSSCIVSFHPRYLLISQKVSRVRNRSVSDVGQLDSGKRTVLEYVLSTLYRRIIQTYVSQQIFQPDSLGRCEEKKTRHNLSVTTWSKARRFVSLSNYYSSHFPANDWMLPTS
jgi:hypothetical protein